MPPRCWHKRKRIAIWQACLLLNTTWAGRPSLAVVTEGVTQGMPPKLKYTRLSTADEASEFKKDIQ